MEATLMDFARKAHQRRRILFGDVRRLQCTILPEGITSRQEAEVLITLDRSVVKADKAWPDFLVAAVRNFVVGSGNGTVPRDTAEWLVETLGSGRPTRTTVAIAREVVRAVNHLGQELSPTVADKQVSRGERELGGGNTISCSPSSGVMSKLPPTRPEQL